MIAIEIESGLEAALRAAGDAPACLDDPLWTSDDPEDLEAAAAELCQGCPALLPCREAGRGEWGTWGGKADTPAVIRARR